MGCNPPHPNPLPKWGEGAQRVRGTVIGSPHEAPRQRATVGADAAAAFDAVGNGLLYEK